MCELLGITSERPYNANSILSVFYTHSRDNEDGWGLAVFHRKGVSMEKEPVKALNSAYLRQRLSREVTSRNLFAHVRKATIGQMEYANCHPFIWDDDSGRTWTLVHNGTIFEPGGSGGYSAMQEGTTDSEKFLIYIVERSNELIRTRGEGYMDIPSNRFLMMEDIIAEMSRGNKLNILLFDEEYMYVHTNSLGTLHMAERDGVRFFATKPLYSEELTDIEWEQVPMYRLLVYKDGEHVWSGHPHSNDFDDSEHDYSSLHSAFAAL